MQPNRFYLAMATVLATTIVACAPTTTSTTTIAEADCTRQRNIGTARYYRTRCEQSESRNDSTVVAEATQE